MSLHVRPLTLKQANELVKKLHRHHKPAVGHRFSLAAFQDKNLVGACIVGRPVGRMVPQYEVCEVVRLVTDGTKNACSLLYGASARAAKAMGFTYIQTYILESEPGTSLKAAGWNCDGIVRKDGKGWNNRAGRDMMQPTEAKVRWRKELNPSPVDCGLVEPQQD